MNVWKECNFRIPPEEIVSLLSKKPKYGDCKIQSRGRNPDCEHCVGPECILQKILNNSLIDEGAEQ